MPLITIFNHSYQLQNGQNLLDALIKKGARVPYSCKAGICQSCLLQLEAGNPPVGSQHCLTEKQINKNYILACQTFVDSDLRLKQIQRDEMPATIIGINPISPTCLAVELCPRFLVEAPTGDAPFSITLCVNPELSGRYRAEHIEGRNLVIQVERKAGDLFSSWVHEHATQGEQVMLYFHY